MFLSISEVQDFPTKWIFFLFSTSLNLWLLQWVWNILASSHSSLWWHVELRQHPEVKCKSEDKDMLLRLQNCSQWIKWPSGTNNSCSTDNYQLWLPFITSSSSNRSVCSCNSASPKIFRTESVGLLPQTFLWGSPMSNLITSPRVWPVGTQAEIQTHFFITQKTI